MSGPVRMSGTGNTFLVLDNRKKVITDLQAYTREQAGQAGVDGCLFAEPPLQHSSDFSMRIINRDGSEAEMCGNGARCMALFVSKQGIAGPSRMVFDTPAGPIRAEVGEDQIVKVQLTDPVDLKKEFDLQTGHFHAPVWSVNTGVPHVVVPVEDAATVDVNLWGREIRNAPEFSPGGTNVNFISPHGNRGIFVRTYERGVEAETKACGTGASASALISSLLGWSDSPVSVLTANQEILTVYFSKKKDRFEGLFLEGSVKFE